MFESASDSNLPKVFGNGPAKVLTAITANNPLGPLPVTVSSSKRAFFYHSGAEIVTLNV